MSMAGTLLSAIYPALLISKFDIIQAAKSAFKSSKEGLLIRKGLVVFQFAVTSIMIVGAYVIYEQMSYLLNRDIGFDPEQVLVINAPNLDDNYDVKYRSFKNNMLQKPRVTSLTSVGNIPGVYNNSLERFKLRQQTNEEAQLIEFHVVNHDFEAVFGLDVLPGRSFDETRDNEQNRVAVMNESAIKLLGLDVLEKASETDLVHITYSNREIPLKLIGVVNDYYNSPMEEPEPMVFMLDEQTYWMSTHYMCFNLSTEEIGQTLKFIESEYNTFFPGDKFNFWFLDKTYNEAYASHLAFQKAFSLFSLLGFLIANLGLIGLSVFTINQAKKELSIRKILGASFKTLYRYFTVKFLKLVLLGSVIGLPIGYYLFNQWLNNYSSRIEIGINFLGFPVLFILFLALVIVTRSIVRAIRTNPINNLRTE